MLVLVKVVSFFLFLLVALKEGRERGGGGWEEDRAVV